MFPHPITPTAHTLHSDTLLRRLLAIDVLVHDALDDSTGFYHMVRSSGRRGFAGIVELLSRFCRLWFWFGIQKNDKNIYLPYVGWIVLDSAVIIGVTIHG